MSVVDLSYIYLLHHPYYRTVCVTCLSSYTNMAVTFLYNFVISFKQPQYNECLMFFFSFLLSKSCLRCQQDHCRQVIISLVQIWLHAQKYVVIVGQPQSHAGKVITYFWLRTLQITKPIEGYSLAHHCTVAQIYAC